MTQARREQRFSKEDRAALREAIYREVSARSAFIREDFYVDDVDADAVLTLLAELRAADMVTLRGFVTGGNTALVTQAQELLDRAARYIEAKPLLPNGPTGGGGT